MNTKNHFWKDNPNNIEIKDEHYLLLPRENILSFCVYFVFLISGNSISYFIKLITAFEVAMK